MSTKAASSIRSACLASSRLSVLRIIEPLEKTVWIDVDADADLRAPFDLGEPIADHVLDIEAAAGVDEEALPMAAPEHREWGGRWAEHRHAFDFRRGVADPASDSFGFACLFG